MFKRLISVVLIISMILCLFCACSEEETVNVIFPITADPECVDPQIAENDSSKLIVYNCMEGLVRIGPDGGFYPAGAKSWEVSSDGLTYTFNLDNRQWQMLRTHKNVLGEDYEETFSPKVVAADFAFGIERALRPETKAENAYLLYPIKNAEKFNKGEASESDLGVKALNDTTLQIVLERPYPDLLRVLTEPMCMPCDEFFFNSTGAKYGLELRYTLCNGPFYMGRWVDDGSVVLYRNESYTSEDYSYDTDAVYLYVNNDEAQFVSKFNQGDYNALCVSDDFVSSVKLSDEIRSLKQPDKTYGFVFNCEDSFLSDINLRRALISAIDISAMLNGDVDLDTAQGIIPDCCRWGESTYREKAGELNLNTYNPDEAVKFFKACVEDNEITNVNISIICTEEFRIPIIRMIQKWEKIFGLAITVSADVVKKDDLDSYVKKGEYQIAFTTLKATQISPVSFLRGFSADGENNYSNYVDEQYNKLVNNKIISASGDKMIELCKSAEQKLINEGVFYPVYKDNSYAFANENVDGIFAISGFNCFDFACWNPERWK